MGEASDERATSLCLSVDGDSLCPRITTYTWRCVFAGDTMGCGGKIIMHDECSMDNEFLQLHLLQSLEARKEAQFVCRGPWKY